MITLLILCLASSSNEEFEERVFEDLSQFSCVGDIGTIPQSHQTNQTLCESTRACNWVTCTDLATPTTCTEANCMDPYMGSENFCLACLSKTNCFEVPWNYFLIWTVSLMDTIIRSPYFRGANTHLSTADLDARHLEVTTILLPAWPR